MSNAGDRGYRRDTPLPRSLEVSLSVALVGYQAHTTVSLTLGKREIGKGVRYRPLGLEVLPRLPETYGEAVEALYEYVSAERSRLSSEDLR